MDKYDSSYSDPYCYTGTTVLKNKLNIKDYDELERAEREITAYFVKFIQYKEPPYNLAYLQTLHKQLFDELYDWAGELRTVDISKDGTQFCHFSYIKSYGNDLFKNLENDKWLKGLNKTSFCKKLAEHYCEFNMLHPFREGNGRVQRLFFEHLALSNGYILNWKSLNRDNWILANIAGVTDYEPMEKIFKKIISKA